MRKTIFIAVVLALSAGPTMADIFFDDFNSEPIGVPATGLTNWDIVSGSVDVIGVGSSWNWFPSYVRYLDMDGTAGGGVSGAGTIQTKTSLNLAAGTYTLSFDLAGNQRANQYDTVQARVTLGSDIVDQTYSLAWDQPFQTYTVPFTVVTAGGYDLSFGASGGDNVGMLLDNVSVVPVPGVVLLGMLGLSVVGVKLRKRA